MITCIACGKVFEGVRQRRRCPPCKRALARRTTSRMLRPGEQIPEGEPRRYLSSHGYMRLRWQVAPRSYIETYEHRVFEGRVRTEDHVHHVDRIRTNNTPANLRPLSAGEHRHVHMPQLWAEEAGRLYLAGLSTYQVGKAVGKDPSTVWRALVKTQIPIRKEARVAIPWREQESR